MVPTLSNFESIKESEIIMFFDEVPIDLAVQAARQKLETILAYLTARHKHPVRSQTP